MNPLIKSDRFLSSSPSFEHLQNWKARVSGYEQLVIAFNQADDDKASEFNKYASLLKKAPMDTNITAQEKGLAAVSAFLSNANMSISAKIANDIVAGCLAKSILQTRPRIKELNQEIILMYIELEKQQLVCEELVGNFENKSPKIAVGCLLYAREALRQFGPRIVKVGPIIKLLPVLLEHKDKNVREETRLLTIEIYRWIKDAMKPQISNLKPVILNELEEEFSKVKDEKASPTRFIRSEQAQVHQPTAEAGTDENATDDAANATAEELDPFEFIEAVEILSKLPANFYEQVEAKKWQERKEAVDAVTHLLETTPKIASGDFGELTKTLKRIIGKDANIVVVLSAAKCLAELARKLRKCFTPYSHSCIMVVIEKFKEKKQNVVQALREAVDACLLSANFEAILEDIAAFLTNKNPQIKQEVIQMITRYIQISKLDFLSNKKNVKTLAGALTKTINDMDMVVRDSSAECLGILSKAVGEKVLTPLISDLEPIKLAKVKEFYETATVKYSVPTASGSVGSKTNVNANDKKATDANRPKIVSSKTATSRPKTTSTLAKKTSSSAISTSNKNLNANGDPPARPATGVLAKSKSAVNATASKTRLLTKQPSAAKLEPENGGKSLPLMTANGQKEQRFQDEKQLKLFKWNFTTPREEFFVELKELMQLAGWNVNLISNCFNSDFKFHLKAIESISDFLSIAENEDAVLHNSDLIFKWIALRFFDTNPSVILKMFDLLLKIFDLMKNRKILLNEIEAQNFIPYLILKTGDPKDVLRQKVHDVLNRIKDIYSPVKLYCYVSTGLSSKNARQRTTCLEELSCFVKTYGTAICQPSFTVACKEISKQIGDKDSSVRNAALNCILELYVFEGEKVLKILGNLNHKELEMLEKRIKRAVRPSGSILVKPLEATISIKDQAVKEFVISGQQASSQPAALSPEPTDHYAPMSQPPPVKANGVPGAHKTLVKPRSALVRPAAKLANSNPLGALNEQHISPPQQSYLQHQFTNSPTAQAMNNHHIQDESSSSPEQTHPAPNPLRGSSALKSRLANSHFGQQSAVKPIQLDFQDTDQEYNRIVEGKESKYSTYRTSTAYKAAHKAHRQEIEDILNESSIDMPKRRFGVGSAYAPAQYSAAAKPDKNLKQLYQNLVSSEMDVVVDTLNQLNEMLNNQKAATEQFADTINELIMRCSMQLRLVKTKYSKNEKDDSKVNSLFQHVTLTLHLVFKNGALAKKISSEALTDLLPRAFDFLIYKKICSKFDDNVNNIIFLILVNTDLTEIFLTIIRLLHRFIAEDKDGQQQSEHTELTIKCFWKLTRLVEKVDQRINVSLILLELKNFLEAFPSSYWKSDPPKNEIAYRTIKTLIYILVKSKKQKIFLYMSKIPNKEHTALYKLLKKAIDQVQEENRNSGEPQPDELSIDELNHISDLLNRLREELKTEYFLQIIEFCHLHPAFNLKEFMQEFHNEFFANYVQEKIAELRADSGLSAKLENGTNGHYSTNLWSTTEQQPPHAATSAPAAAGNKFAMPPNSELSKKPNFGFDRSNLIDKKNLIELKRLTTKPEELNVENVQEWYRQNMKLLGADAPEHKKPLDDRRSNYQTSEFSNLDDAVKESFKRTESILNKTKEFIQQHDK